MSGTVPHPDLRSRRGAVGVWLAACALAVPSAALGQPRVWHDPAGDAVARPTDPAGQINPASTLPDVVLVILTGWEPDDPAVDPYRGRVVPSKDADMFRLDIVFNGLVNPPGPLDIGGIGYDPYRHGPSPVYGFLDIDVDGDPDTGGQTTSGDASRRYLANVGRFGKLPAGNLAERAAGWGWEVDGDFFTAPQYHRSGADFTVSFCGCWELRNIRRFGSGQPTFGGGDTWIVEGRFFQRVQGYIGASRAFNGSEPWRYDPWVDLRFSHDPAHDRTVVTLVEALTKEGAAKLRAEAPGPLNFNVEDQPCVEEAVWDVIQSRTLVPRPSGQTRVLAERWWDKSPSDALDLGRWRITGLFGTAYMTPPPSGAMYVWTDTGFGEVRGDFTGNGKAGPEDAMALREAVYRFDGTFRDADGSKNGVIVLGGFPENFSVFDLNGDGLVDGEDLWFYGHRADLDGDGKLTVFDLLVFTDLFMRRNPVADFDLNEKFDSFDFLAFLDAFSR
jgi:hypothetical protein